MGFCATAAGEAGVVRAGASGGATSTNGNRTAVVYGAQPEALVQLPANS